MPGARWFPGATLNYAEHMRRPRRGPRAASRSSPARRRASPIELTFGELRDQVARARAGLQRLGVGPGDRVVAYLPNIPETLVAFLATASLGAIWATCAPEFGAAQRDRPLRPARAEGAARGRRLRLRRPARRPPRARWPAIRAALPTLEHVVHVPYAGGPTTRSRTRSRWDELLAEPRAARVRPGRRSTTRCTCCSRPARPGCRRRSSTATAGSWSSTSRTSA